MVRSGVEGGKEWGGGSRVTTNEIHLRRSVSSEISLRAYIMEFVEYFDRERIGLRGCTERLQIRIKALAVLVGQLSLSVG